MIFLCTLNVEKLSFRFKRLPDYGKNLHQKSWIAVCLTIVLGIFSPCLLTEELCHVLVEFAKEKF